MHYRPTVADEELFYRKFGYHLYIHSIYGFDLFRLETKINVPPNISMSGWIKEHYGQEAHDLVKRLIDGVEEPEWLLYPNGKHIEPGRPGLIKIAAYDKPVRKTTANQKVSCIIGHNEQALAPFKETGRGWDLTHVYSGYNIGVSTNTLEEAKHLAATIVKAAPFSKENPQGATTLEALTEIIIQWKAENTHD